jgi:phage tail P2-like protein
MQQLNTDDRSQTLSSVLSPLSSGTLLPPPLARDLSLRALEDVICRLSRLDIRPLLVYDFAHVEASALDSLAEQFSLTDGDGWDLVESDDARRAMLQSAIAMHRLKGTPWSIRELVRRLGFGEIDLIEHIGRLNYDGRRQYNGYMLHGDPDAWPIYRVVLLDRALTNEQAVRLASALASWAPLRCHLASLEYQSVPIRYNSVAAYDGAYNHGSWHNG